MLTDTVTIAEFIHSNRIALTAQRASSNPAMPASFDMDHWKCVLRRPRHTLTVYFSMGRGHHGKEPVCANVLDCLASESARIDNSNKFDDWCADFGYDTDSRKAERAFKSCQHQALRLKTFLGSSLYAELLYGTERL